VTTTDHRVERYVDVDLYDVLHITAEASTALIERAYKMRVAEVHPDRAGAASTERAALVNATGEILRQPVLRARYDALRAERRARTATAQDIPPSQRAGSKSSDEGRQELEKQLATALQQLAATQVELAATETKRRDLAEQLRWRVSQARNRPSRWRG
jgi:DnaJ-class molecular chaperone